MGVKCKGASEIGVKARSRANQRELDEQGNRNRAEERMVQAGDKGGGGRVGGRQGG